MQQVTSLSNPSFLNSENLLAQKSRVKTTSCLDFCPRVYRQHRLLYLKLKRWGKQRFQPIFSVSAFWRALAAFALFSCFEGLACLYSISITQLQRPLAPFGAIFTSFAMEICFKSDFIFHFISAVSLPQYTPRCHHLPKKASPLHFLALPQPFLPKWFRAVRFFFFLSVSLVE